MQSKRDHKLHVLPWTSNLPNMHVLVSCHAAPVLLLAGEAAYTQSWHAPTNAGIDSMYCGHVVLFDFPRDPSEYVRRVGCTARAGIKGVVTVLVLGRQV